MHEERRSAARFPLNAPVRYYHRGRSVFSNTVGRDISERGIGFVSEEFFPRSTRLIFETRDPKTEDIIKAVGEVIWVSRQPFAERYSVGARFIGPPLPISE